VLATLCPHEQALACVRTHLRAMPSSWRHPVFIGCVGQVQSMGGSCLMLRLQCSAQPTNRPTQQGFSSGCPPAWVWAERLGSMAGWGDKGNRQPWFLCTKNACAVLCTSDGWCNLDAGATNTSKCARTCFKHLSSCAGYANPCCAPGMQVCVGTRFDLHNAMQV